MRELGDDVTHSQTDTRTQPFIVKDNIIFYLYFKTKTITKYKTHSNQPKATLFALKTLFISVQYLPFAILLKKEETDQSLIIRPNPECM